MASLAPSSRIAERFTVVAPLPDRGVGEAYHCTDPARANGPVLVKLLRPTGPALPPPLADLLARTKLARHDGVLRLLDHGVWRDRPFLAYEYFEGSSLGDGLDRARAEGTVLPVELLREVFDGVVAALDYAHTKAPKGVLHLGVDPSCVILRRLPGKPLKLKVLDFGLAAWADPEPDVPAGSARRLRCAAPESYAGEASPTSDVFALGALLRELLAPVAVAGAEPSGARRWRDDVPEELLAVLTQATDLARERRHASVAAFAQAVRTAWARPLPARPTAPEPAAERATDPDGPTLAPPAQPSLKAAPRAMPVEGPLPALPPAADARAAAEARAAAVRAQIAAQGDAGDTVSLVNVAARRPPSPWDIGALRDERAVREEEAAAGWFRPRPTSADATIVASNRGPRADGAAPRPPADESETVVSWARPAPAPPPAPPAPPPRPAVSDVDATIVVAHPSSDWPRAAMPAQSPPPPAAPQPPPPPAVVPSRPTAASPAPPRPRRWVAVAVGVLLFLVAGGLLALRS